MEKEEEFKDLLEDILYKVSDRLPVEVEYWDGVIKSFSSNRPVARVIFKTPQALKEAIEFPSLGFGENYTNGNIEVEGNLQEFLRLQEFDEVKNIKPPFKLMMKIFLERIKNNGSIEKTKENIPRHYDLSNEFFSLFLDKSMTYSCAYFRKGDETLEEAQKNKYELICRKIGLKDGDSVVDVGCGWGGFLIYAAKKNKITGKGCTLSKNQFTYANEKIDKEGLGGQISVEYKDYRNMTGVYDKFVSIGAYEHVGKGYAGVFFKKVYSLLKEGGIGLLHTIGHNKPMPTDPWITKYIFPGGYLPSLEELVRALRRQNFYIIDVENLRPHYAKTLDKWIENFENNIDKIRKMYSESFIRMWRLYLNAASESFKYGESQVYQILFSKGKPHIELYRGRIYENWN